MSPSEFQAAVLAFLDQFISRGAAPDILDLRERLASDQGVQQQLLAQLPNEDPTEREAFDAMTAFLNIDWERVQKRYPPIGPPGLSDLIAWTSWGSQIEGGDATSDPAQWHDWLASVGRVRDPD